MPPSLLALLLIASCNSAPPADAPPPDPGPALERVTATLDEAVRLDRDRREEEARDAWRRAHATFDEQLEPALSAVLEPREVVLTEYLFGRVRSEIDQASGRPGVPARDLITRLQEQVAAVVPPES